MRTSQSTADASPLGESDARHRAWPPWYRTEVANPQNPDLVYPDEAVLRRHGLEPDPVIEAYKKDVDRSLLRQNLRRSPEERWRNFMQAMRLAEEVKRAGAKARGR